MGEDEVACAFACDAPVVVVQCEVVVLAEQDAAVDICVPALFPRVNVVCFAVGGGAFELVKLCV